MSTIEYPTHWADGRPYVPPTPPQATAWEIAWLCLKPLVVVALVITSPIWIFPVLIGHMIWDMLP